MPPSRSATRRSWRPTATAPARPSFSGVALTLNAGSDAEAEKLFNALGKGGQVQMPIGETFFAYRFGMVADKFGVLWMVLGQARRSDPQRPASELLSGRERECGDARSNLRYRGTPIEPIAPGMTDPSLTSEEFAALRSIDGSMLQRRPSMEMEVRLRSLGLIHRDGMSRLPVRTAAGDALIKAGRRRTPEAVSRRQAFSTLALRSGTPNSRRQTSASTSTPFLMVSGSGLAKQRRSRHRA